MGTLKRMLWVSALAASFATLHAVAKEPVKSEPEAKRKAPPKGTQPTGGKAKVGEACKTNADCDQSSGEMICGRGKCEYDVSGAHPET